MKVPHHESSYGSRSAEPGRDIVSCDNVRLQVGREGEDGDPGGEDVSECVHLDGKVGQLASANRLMIIDGKHKPMRKCTPASRDRLGLSRLPTSRLCLRRSRIVR